MKQFMQTGCCFINTIPVSLIHNMVDPFFNPQPPKMAKHIQTIRRLLPTNCLSVFGHFVELALRNVNKMLVINFILSVCLCVFGIPHTRFD